MGCKEARSETPLPETPLVIHTSDSCTHRHPPLNRKNAILHGITSPLRIAALLISVISLHLFVVRPLVARVHHLETELQHVTESMLELAAYDESLATNNDLLSSLKQQHEDLAAARATVRQLSQLRLEIEKEADRIPEAMAAVTRISTLPDHVFSSEAERQAQLDSVPDIQVPEPELESAPVPVFPLLARSSFEISRAENSPTPMPLRIERNVRRVESAADQATDKSAWQMTIQAR